MYTSQDEKLLHIGYLINGKFTCHACDIGIYNWTTVTCEMYLINILPYSQTCQECGKTSVKGKAGFPNLFD